MTNGGKLAKVNWERSIAEARKLAEQRGINLDTCTFENILGSSAGSWVGDGDGTMVTLVVGAGGDLNRASAQRAANAFLHVARTFPKAKITIVVAGYDTDLRECDEIPEVAEQLQHFACLAGVDTLTTAIASPLHRNSIGLLGACSALRDFDADNVVRIGPPSRAKH
jgi:hypothetical protein